ncbi:hypothetical protein C9374_008219 [Naegleria lovaniensis]|uniref:RGS domain-containing protein n=1 Tax=Naegleria lovaniensis TaxID=51637 RepID=A0AA88KGE8_NAELO|nr:uncharacterized protein C9374_008219 [Naegleria lovaniensis]KAG2378580.1 hypothetical protein C9374_008219 [Naegleria lovaniensis]
MSQPHNVLALTLQPSSSIPSQSSHQQQERIFISDLHATSDHNDQEDDDACSDADSIIVHFTHRRTLTKPLVPSFQPTTLTHRQDFPYYSSSSMMDRKSHGSSQTTLISTNMRHPPKEYQSSCDTNIAPLTVYSKATTAKTTTRSTTHSASAVRIPTCCGVIELNLIRVLCLFGMIVNICCFIAVAAVVGNSFRLEAKKEISLLLQRASFLQLYDQTACLVRLAASTGSLKYVPLYYESQTNTSRVLLEMSQNLPPDVLAKTKFDPKNPGYVKYDQQVIEAVQEGDLITANRVLKSFSYVVWDAYATYFKDYVTQEVKKLSLQKQDYLKYSSTVNMILVLLGVVISIPIVMIIFALAMTSEQVSSRKLKKATLFMILETLRNEKSSQLFKEFCEKENQLEKYTFLENCHTYREMCEKSIEMRRTQWNIGDEVSNLEQIKEIEKNKYEMAFKIFTEFIDTNGENPFPTSDKFQEHVKSKLDEFSSESPVLDGHLFDELEKEICDSLLDSFMKFKKELRMKKKVQK